MTDDWLSLKGASAILGVHPSTVRAWSDKGMLPVHRTQGGHRRYKRSEVEMWAEHARSPQDIAPEALVQSAVRNVRMRIADGSLEAQVWYQKLDEEARTQYRQSAQMLFQGLMAYLASDGENVEFQSHAIGYSYAARARRNNLSYVDAAQAFLLFPQCADRIGRQGVPRGACFLRTFLGGYAPPHAFLHRRDPDQPAKDL